MPRSALTGTEKKAKKAAIKSAKERDKLALKGYKSGIHELSRLLEGKHAIPSDLGDIMERYKRAGKGAEKIFAPIREQTVSEFEQLQSPDIRTNLGSAMGQGSRSSAMNQALAAARGNLERGLASDFAGLQANLASNLLGQSQQAKLSNLNAYLSAASGLTGQGVNPVMQSLAGQASYLPSSNQPNRGLAAAMPIAGAALGGGIGFLAGGPAGALTGAKLGGTLGGTAGALFNS